MSDERNKRGTVKLPVDLLDTDDDEADREQREQAAISAIEARLRAGEITVRQADALLMAIALDEFDFLSEAGQRALRERAEALLEESPELVESRQDVASHYRAETDPEDEPR